MNLKKYIYFKKTSSLITKNTCGYKRYKRNRYGELSLYGCCGALRMKREIKICDECESEYFTDTSQMMKLCPDCSHYLYGYQNCEHDFQKGRCSKCHWN